MAKIYLDVLGDNRDKRLRIWTYDSEFTRVWRKSSGRTDRPGL